MAELTKEIYDIVNYPGRVGVLGTADKEGKPDAAYFGSPRLTEEGTLVVGSGDNLTLHNLHENPQAVFFCVDEAPVKPTTPGCRLYLKVREILKEGPVLEAIRDNISRNFSADAAKMIVAAIVFDVIEVRPLLAKGY